MKCIGGMVTLLTKSKDFKNMKKISILLVAYVLSCIVLYGTVTKGVLGPFIPLDEPTYFNLSRSIWENFSYQNHNQYNPLYPLLVSPVFALGDVVLAYDAIKLLNILIFSSMVFPLYFLCEKRLGEGFFSYAIAVVVVFLPWKTVVNLIWAEPLYYPLICWSILFFQLYIEKKSLERAFCLGAFLGLLFLTKQAGLVLVIATFFALIIEFILAERRNIFFLKRHLVVFGSISVFVLPWIVRNFVISDGMRGMLGYSSSVPKLWMGIVDVVTLIQAFCFQLSYLALSLYFLFLVLFVVAFFSIKKYKVENRPLLSLVFFYTAGILLLCAFHRIKLASLPYGRYVSTSIPFIVILAVEFLLKNQEKGLAFRQRILFFSVCSILFLLGLVFSPLEKSLFAYGYLNNFDLTVWNDFFFGANKFLWTSKNNPHNDLVPLILFCSVCAFMFLKSKKLKIFVVCLVLLFMVYAGTRSAYYVHRLGLTQTCGNELFRYIVRNEIPSDKIVAFVKLNYLDLAWLGKELEKVTPNYLVNNNRELYVITKEVLPYQLIYQNKAMFFYRVNANFP